MYHVLMHNINHPRDNQIPNTVGRVIFVRLNFRSETSWNEIRYNAHTASVRIKYVGMKPEQKLK